MMLMMLRVMALTKMVVVVMILFRYCISIELTCEAQRQTIPIQAVVVEVCLAIVKSLSQ